MADEKLTAATRIEKLMDNIAGGDNDVTPATRLEKFLSYIADAMEGGGGSGGGGVQLYGPYTAKNVTGAQYGSASVITFGVGSMFTNRLSIYDNDDTQRRWNDEAKFLLSGIETPGGTILKAVGCLYGDPPIAALKREDESISQITAGSLFISFYTDVELEKSGVE